MADIEQYQQGDGSYYVRPKGALVEADIEQIIETLKSIYQPTQATYVILDFEGNYVLPIRVLSSQIRIFFRDTTNSKAPLFLAMVVESALVQVMDSVMKTLVRREVIQAFTEVKRAKQWLMLERLKQQNVKDIGSIMRGEDDTQAE